MKSSNMKLLYIIHNIKVNSFYFYTHILGNHLNQEAHREGKRFEVDCLFQNVSLPSVLEYIV